MNKLHFQIFAVLIAIQSLAISLSLWWFSSPWSMLILFAVACLLMIIVIGWLLRPYRNFYEKIKKTHAQLLKSQSGTNEIQVLSSAIDQLFQQLAEYRQQLIQKQIQFDAVLSGMEEGLIAVDGNSRILFFNRAARKMMSINLGDLIGKSLVGVVRFESVQHAVRESAQTAKTVSINFNTYDNPPRYIQLKVSPMDDQSVPGQTLVFRDLTELTRLETIRRDFVANVSHELKTPLASIKGYAETLLLGAIDKVPVNRDFVERINKQADILNQQIVDLLQLARVESGRAAFELELVNLNESCREIFLSFRDEASQKNVDLTTVSRLDELESIDIWADNEAIKTILSNLVSNAIRYSQLPASNRQAIVQIVLDADEQNAIVEVTDNGIGIAKEHQQRIFERFFRVDPARSREQGGTGLGLSIVKHLTQSFNGQIELESSSGHGSAFRMIFPRYHSYGVGGQPPGDFSK